VGIARVLGELGVSHIVEMDAAVELRLDVGGMGGIPMDMGVSLAGGGVCMADRYQPRP
jgi:hypothetical protein